MRKLLSSLDDSRNNIFVHIDRKASFGPDDLKGSCSKAGLFFTDNRISVSWGGVSIMRAELELLKKATSTGVHDYYHLLSGMDLPIKSQDTIHAFFDNTPGKEFIHFWKFKSHTHRRFHYYTLFPEGAGKPLPNLANNIVKGILMLLHIKMNKDIEFKFASQWFSITHNFATYTVGQEAWLEKVFRHTNTVDEIFLPTLAWNSEFRNNLYDAKEYEENKDIHVQSGMRFIDWTRGKSVRHPWTFTIDDLELLKSVPQFWARKFDERVDSRIIDEVCRMTKESF